MVHKWRIFLSVFEESDVRKDAGLIIARRRENSWSYLSSLVKKKQKNGVKSVALHHVIINCSAIVSNDATNAFNKIYRVHTTFCPNQL